MEKGVSRDQEWNEHGETENCFGGDGRNSSTLMHCFKLHSHSGSCEAIVIQAGMMFPKAEW